MYEVDITETDDERSAAKAVAALRRFPMSAQRKLERAVERERNGHRYTNRTFAAETNTVAITVESRAGDVDIRVEMAVPYASYLNDGGWSKFDQNVRAAIDSIDGDAEKLK